MNTCVKEYDVVVLGAGPGGLAAALAAARNGAKVLLAEKNGYLGGNMTIGLPLLGFLDKDGRQVIGGIAQEFMTDMANYETAYGHAASAHRPCPKHNSVTLYDHELFKIMALKKVIAAGIDYLFHVEIERACVDSGKLREIVLTGKGWKIHVKAKVFIDGTGDGDMAYLCGASYVKQEKLQPPTMMFTLGGVDMAKTFDYIEEHPEEMTTTATIQVGDGYDAAYFKADPTWVFVGLRRLYARLRAEGKMPVNRESIIVINSLLPGQVHMNCTRHQGTDGSDVFSVTKAEGEAYLQIEEFVNTLHEYVPGFEKCYITNIFPSLGIRETRKFSGIRTLTEQDVTTAHFPEDTVGIGSYSIDIHMADGLGTVFTRIPPYGIPYGITVSDEIEGLMFAGRCASMDAVAMSSARVMPICMIIGEAAGVGAALAVKQGISPAEVNVAEVRQVLKDSGVMLECP